MGGHIGHSTATAAHLLLRRVLVAVAVPVAMAMTVIAGRWRWRWMVGVLRLFLLLLSNLLDCHEALLAHLYPLRHITDGGVF